MRIKFFQAVIVFGAFLTNSSTAAEIPDVFRGKWSTPLDCRTSDHTEKNWVDGDRIRLFIKRKSFEEVENGCNIIKVISFDKNYFKAKYSCQEAGNDPTVATITFELKGGKLYIGDDSDPLIKCR